ncbi:chemotaxis protein CheA [Oleiharenicola lentus]|uniref:chemotaxis protein CheA n=1 Tax=Oleiharenicola lentus TaxID=2508720 RepID=UPI003F679B98
MTGDPSSEFAPELLDDFYSECDEQLGALRQLLEELETSRDGISPAEVETLFRNMHSLKGNAAIVGLREAEALAHAAEDYLRALTRQEVVFTGRGADVLLQAVHRLEKTISAHRHRVAIPAVEDLSRLLQQLAASETPGLAAAKPVTPAAPQGKAYTFKFVPSRELDARGVNVAAIRGRLAALGAITRSAPLIGEDRSIAFEFVVELAETPRTEDWSADGVTFTALAVEATPQLAGLTSTQTEVADDSAFLAPSHIVRVDIGKLDDLLRIAGELVIHRSRLDDRLNQGSTDKSDLKEVNQALTRSLRELREAITRVRLVPVGEAFARLPFVVRDLVRHTAKQARLVVEGKNTEIDKYLVERLKEPLLHLVRNAVSHGLETSTERLAAGKPAEGTIQVQATASGGFVLIKIRDDGRGLDPKRIAARAARLNISVPAQLDEKAMLDVICAPGFSTQEAVDRASGRGVGMNVVSDVVRELGGSLSLQTTLGVSTQFTLRLPLTLSIVEALLFSVAGQTCAVPQSAVQEIIEVSDETIRTINQTEIMPYRDGVLPVVHLEKLFGTARTRGGGVKPVLVVHSDVGVAGLVVDRIIGQREVVVRPLEDPLIRVRGIAGATELGDGRPVLILDALALLEGAVRPMSPIRPESASNSAPFRA